MKQDEIIEMADDVGAFGYVHDAGDAPHKWQFNNEQLEAFSKLVAAKEREACAVVCEDIDTNGDGAECWLEIAANSIRARGEA